MDKIIIADEISKAISQTQQIVPFSKRGILLSLQDAYDVASLVRENLDSPPEVGKKIRITNRNIWDVYNVNAPIWGPITSKSVSFTETNFQKIDLSRFCVPRIEPEVVVCLKKQKNFVTSLSHKKVVSRKVLHVHVSTYNQTARTDSVPKEQLDRLECSRLQLLAELALARLHDRGQLFGDEPVKGLRRPPLLPDLRKHERAVRRHVAVRLLALEIAHPAELLLREAGALERAER